MLTWLPSSGQTLVVLLAVLAAASGTVHVLLRKRHARSAIGWIALMWLSPVFGVTLYALLGINRLERTDRLLQDRRPPADGDGDRVDVAPRELARLVDQVSRRPIRAGNAVDPLLDGEPAYGAMLEAIREAEHSIALTVYIFDVDPTGEVFLDALGEAARRGVEVRVIVDGLGARYAFPHNAIRQLQRRGVRAAPFLWSLRRIPTINLRSHRKLLVVDGWRAFTGGMNLRHTYLETETGKRTRDMMFALRGPVVADLQRVFADDWLLTTGERLEGDTWFPAQEAHGTVCARALPTGPDGNFDVAPWTLIGALSVARERVRILTPYFLPEEELETVIKATAMRGVRVDLVLPEHINLSFLHWAAMSELGEMIDLGVRVWLAPPPFDHSKLMVVDEDWVLFGSSNWDARSLRLNFELNVEAYDADLARAAGAEIDRRRDGSRLLTRAELDQRGVLIRLRDRAFWLMRPYL